MSTTATKIRATIATLAAAFAFSIASASVATALPNDTTAPTENSGTAQPGSTEKKKEDEVQADPRRPKVDCTASDKAIAEQSALIAQLKLNGADAQRIAEETEFLSLLLGMAARKGC